MGAMLSTEQMIGQIYDAALKPELWNTVLQNVAAYTQCQSAIFTAIDQLSPAYNFTFSHNIPEQALQAYQEERIQIIDMRLHAPLLMRAGIGEPSIALWKHYVNMPDTDEYVFYQRCVKPSGLGSANGILLENGKFRWAVFAVHRGLNEPDFDQQDLAKMRCLSEHLRRALQIHRQITLLKQEKQQAYNVLDCLKVGVLILDHDSRVIFSNQKAKTVLEKSSALTIDAFDCLQTANHQQQAQLNTYILGALFRSTTVQQSLPVGGILGLSDADGGLALMLSIVPLSKLAYVAQNSADEQKVAIFLTEPKHQHQLATAYLKQMYKLSKRELELCEWFVNGLELKEIAQQCGITYESTRTYFKYMFEKTGCTSQNELMQLLMGVTVDFEHIVSVKAADTVCLRQQS